ncbi:MAG: hypothetical protein ACE5SW_13580 [Nitrososphaeraceae archaeon]
MKDDSMTKQVLYFIIRILNQDCFKLKRLTSRENGIFPDTKLAAGRTNVRIFIK